jgi:hypothetical protein
MLRSVKENRLLSFEEYLSPECRRLCYSGVDLVGSGLQPVDNSPEELREVVEEMLEHLECSGDFGWDDGVAAFESVARRNGLVGFSRIGRDFVARHRQLLQASPVRKAS